MQNLLTTGRKLDRWRIVEIDDLEEESVDIDPAELPFSVPILHIAFILILVLI